MDKYISLGKLNVTASVSYCNVFNHYTIGIQVGGIYTILNEKFRSKNEAIDYVYDNF